MIWITGPSRIGKTTLAKAIAGRTKVLLDGDAMRKCWTLGFSKADRIENNMRIGSIASMLEAQGFEVVVATICPYDELRKRLEQFFNIRWIHLKG